MSLCLKRYPRQLQRKEINKIKGMLTSPSYEHWPIVSIAALALRKGSVVASLYSWYKYARLFELSHKWYTRTKKQVGLIATKPNEYLHIDTTYYYISEGKKVCITFVMDNYSKMILGFSVEERLSFTLIRTAITNALIPIGEKQKQNHCFLVSDGGKENNNKQIDQFISEIAEHRLTKIVALKDIQFSNSPVEAIHKIMKGRYIKNRKFESLEGLAKFLNEAVHDYNYQRPHYKHFPKTPAEAYFDITLKLDVRKRISKTVRQRVKNNLATACTACKKPFKNILLSLTPTSSSLSPINKTYDRP
jgi:putative transposase